MWRSWTLRDQIQAPGMPGCFWCGVFRVWAQDRAAADVTARIHFACLLRQAGRL